MSSDEEQLMTHTTSQYPHTEKQADTTQEEVAAPGKLPETPLRMDPLLLYNDGYEYTDDRDQSRSDQNQSEASSSYSVRGGMDPNGGGWGFRESGLCDRSAPIRPCVAGWRR